MPDGTTAEAQHMTSVREAAAMGLFERIKSLDFIQLLVVILLFALVATVGYGLPWMAEKIEAFGTKMEASHREERAQSAKEYREEREQKEVQHTEQIKATTAAFERTLDRVERKARDRDNAVGHAAVDPGPPGTGGSQ
jgi:proline racemase